MNDLEKKIDAILKRNNQVEAEKAWETSWFRRISIFILIYIISLVFLRSINSNPYFLQALVPSGGYILSTLSLPFIKKRWLTKNMRQKGIR